MNKEEKPKIIKMSSILFDGNQLTLKIPKEIAQAYNMEKGDKFIWNVRPHENKIECEVMKLQ